MPAACCSTGSPSRPSPSGPRPTAPSLENKQNRAILRGEVSEGDTNFRYLLLRAKKGSSQEKNKRFPSSQVQRKNARCTQPTQCSSNLRPAPLLRARLSLYGLALAYSGL